MALTIATGYLGTLAKITIGTQVFNDRAAALPRADITSIPNLYDLPDGDDIVEKKMGFWGEVNRSSFSRGRTINYVGMAYGNDALELFEFVHAIRTKLAGLPGTPARSTVVEVLHTPHTSLGTVEWGYIGRVGAFNADEDPSANRADDVISRYQMPFTIAMRNLDGRWYVTDEVDVGPFTDGATHVEAVAGVAPTDPIITGSVTGAGVIDMRFENLSLDVEGTTALIRYVNGADDDFAVGDYVLDWYARSLMVTPSVGDPFDGWDHYLQYSDNWTKEFVPGLIPGNNSIKVTGLDSWHLKYKVRSW